jgi:hypothetical protein
LAGEATIGGATEVKALRNWSFMSDPLRNIGYYNWRAGRRTRTDRRHRSIIEPPIDNRNQVMMNPCPD